MEEFRRNSLLVTIDCDYNIQENNCNKEDVKKLENFIKQLDKCFSRDNQNFAEMCYLVFNMKELFNNFKYKRIYAKGARDKFSCGYTFDSIMAGFGLDNTQTCRMYSCYEKFVTKLENEKPTLIEEFKNFSKSKLIELITVPNEQIIKDIQQRVLREDMSVKSIRDYVKNYRELTKANSKLDKDKEDKEEIIEEDIPMAYNPKQHYDFDYFETKSKAQLLNMIWDLQKEYENLKKEKKKNEK